MKYFAVLLLLPLTLAISIGGAFAASHSSSHSGSSHHSTNSHATGSHAKVAVVPRDSHGKIARSKSARSTFEHSHPCPSTGRTSGACPGYVVDHVVPLKGGGPDAPSNMQWQTVDAAKVKDKVE